MADTRYSDEEVARRGQVLYEQSIRGRVETEHFGEFLVVDIETGDYEVAAQDIDAVQRAKARRPDAPLYIVRVGYPAAYNLGGGNTSAVCNSMRAFRA